jgi:hypothetical protein
MVAVPAATPVTMPVAEPTVATAVLLLLQVPPPDASASAVVAPAHAVNVPVMTETLLTVTGVVAKQEPTEYEMVAPPAATPSMVPVDEPMLAIPVLLLDHTPPPGDDASVDVPPVHMDVVPVIADGLAFTVMAMVEKHPPLKV